MRRPILARTACGIVLVGVAVAALALGQGDGRDAAARAELGRLRQAEADRATTAGRAPASPLCGALRATTRGVLDDPSLDELSGLVAGRRSRAVLWSLEDSGGPPALVALTGTGRVHSATWTLPGAENLDWEDIAAGPGPGGPVLYAADIGDNAGERERITVLRVPEPRDPATGGTTAPPLRLDLTYPDGAHDAETLLVDPRRRTIVVVTKGLAGGAAYAATPPPGFAGSARLRRVASIGVPLATGGDVSADGRTIAVRGYLSLSVWRRRGDEPIARTLRRRPCVSPTALDDGQGEALALSRDGRLAWTVAEGAPATVRRLAPARR